MGSSHANTKAERDLTSKPRSGSLDNINAPTVKLEEVSINSLARLTDRHIAPRRFSSHSR